MQQAQTASNGTVPVFTADEGNDSLAAMVTRALDEWNVIQYYQQLLELERIESADSIALLTDCYLKLSEPHRDELELTLRAMHKLIRTIPKGT
ncbi:hypothetical protein PQG02_09435 [Nostoc sp. UHCC 0926]|uniref:hypothetical protein n=1 Tax=unclassified Nostoc TaxID=2593658 RepID=UPI002360238C|nr:hypothetical protein [Nostoc sp. UHCC 0926]WDD34521.1 hypothetical protein PQG02_09435 [Nostoc sp. UHCC 0926]